MDEARPLDYARQLGVTWLLEAKHNIRGKTELSTGAALCFRPDGYLMTAYHVISDDNRPSQTIFARRNHDEDFFSTTYVCGFPSLDLAILKIDSDEQDFLFKPLTRDIKLSVGDELVTHGHASLLPYSSAFGRCGYRYQPCIDLNSMLGDFEDEKYCVRNMQKEELNEIRENTLNPPFRTPAGIVDFDDEQILHFNPNLPLIEFDSEVGGGFSGSPVFGRYDDKLVGILIFGDESTFIVPVDVCAFITNYVCDMLEAPAGGRKSPRDEAL